MESEGRDSDKALAGQWKLSWNSPLEVEKILPESSASGDQAPIHHLSPETEQILKIMLANVGFVLYIGNTIQYIVVIYTIPDVLSNLILVMMENR
jgi:hypothetical protein